MDVDKSEISKYNILFKNVCFKLNRLTKKLEKNTSKIKNVND
jgi:hypothetical protein